MFHIRKHNGVRHTKISLKGTVSHVNQAVRMAIVLESWRGGGTGFCFCYDIMAEGTTTVVSPLSAGVRTLS